MRMATMRQNISSALGKSFVEISSAGQMRGTLMVCGPTPKGGFHMFRMHQQSDKVVFISVETEQHSQAHIVYAGFHGAVHSFGVVSIFAFRSGGMQGFVVFLCDKFPETGYRYRCLASHQT